jgi:polysaccharide pyruvyl transferase WcaK-like protein
MKTITILGNLSGRNAGDAAILGNLLRDIAAVRRDVRFLVPTTNPQFITRHFGHYNLQPVGLRPWNLALKNLGWPLFRAMVFTDMVLITDNILFDRKFYNPVFNNLSSISLWAPLCRRRQIPIVFYNASAGPIQSRAGARALQRVLDASPLLLLRDRQSVQMMDRLGLRHPPARLHADCAINTTPPGPQRMEWIIRREGLFTNPRGTMGFNVNAYIDNWGMQGRFQRESFVALIAEALDRLMEKLGVDAVFIVTQPMDMDNTRACVARMRQRQRVRIISNREYTYEEITGVLARVELHAGLRTHPLIFCAAVGTPMVNINSYPKSAGFMASIGQQRWQIEVRDLTVEPLVALVSQAWEERSATRASLAASIPGEKAKARHSAVLVSRLLG